MEISAQKVKELREKTGTGLMECKKALQENDGDIEKAIRYLKEKGILDASKRSGRSTEEGIVQINISSDKKKAVILELNCETDFVARTDDFAKTANTLAEKILDDSSIKTPSDLKGDFETMIKEAIAKLGENIVLKSFAKYIAEEGDDLVGYIHPGSKVGTLAVFNANPASIISNAEFITLTKDLCMHITAAAPLSIQDSDMDQNIVKEQREIFLKQAENSGKNPDILSKMVDGKMSKFFKEFCLLEQPFVKNQDVIVKDLLGKLGSSLNGKITVKSFTRYKLGE